MLRINGLLLILLFVVFVGCKKYKEKQKINATLSVQVVNVDGKPIVNSKIYLKGGGGHNPQIPLSQYDQQAESNTEGFALFTELGTDDYFVYATAQLSTTYQAVGSTTVAMVRKAKPNRYERRITVQ